MIVCIVLAIVIFIIMTIGIGIGIKEEDAEVVMGIIVSGIVIIVVLLVPFVSIDRSSGQTIGIITSVDRNFFGSTAIYIKTSETEQEKYCAENKKVIEYAKEHIGKKVKIKYGTRIGLYPLKKCHKAPIDKIEVIDDDRNN